MTTESSKARRGPFYTYDVSEMPDDLRREFYRNFHGDGLIRWIVDRPGGPFSDDPKDYTVENYGDAIKFNADVDAWLKSVGAVPGEVALVS